MALPPFRPSKEGVALPPQNFSLRSSFFPPVDLLRDSLPFPFFSPSVASPSASFFFRIYWQHAVLPLFSGALRGYPTYLFFLPSLVTHERLSLPFRVSFLSLFSCSSRQAPAASSSLRVLFSLSPNKCLGFPPFYPPAKLPPPYPAAQPSPTTLPPLYIFLFIPFGPLCGHEHPLFQTRTDDHFPWVTLALILFPY